MKETVSTLMDGELNRHEAARAIETIYTQDSLQRIWNEYHLIRDALRSSDALLTDLSLAAAPGALDKSLGLTRPVGSRRPPLRALVGVALAATIIVTAGVMWQHRAIFEDSHQLATQHPLASSTHTTPLPSKDEDPYFLAHRDIARPQHTANIVYRDRTQR